MEHHLYRFIAWIVLQWNLDLCFKCPSANTSTLLLLLHSRSASPEKMVMEWASEIVTHGYLWEINLWYIMSDNLWPGLPSARKFLKINLYITDIKSWASLQDSFLSLWREKGLFTVRYFSSCCWCLNWGWSTAMQKHPVSYEQLKFKPSWNDKFIADGYKPSHLVCLTVDKSIFVSSM